MKNQWEVKWWRVALALLIIFASLFALESVWMQWAEWQEVRGFCRDNPNLAALPVPLPDKSVASLNGVQLEIPGLSFQVPWKEIRRRWEARTASMVSFEDGPGVLIRDRSATAAKIEETIRNRSKTKLETDETKKVIGSQALNCCYDLMVSELAATPTDLKWWNTERTRRTIMFRLEMKSFDIMRANAIYEINAGEMHGFQMGNPAVAPYGVVLQLFDRDDRRHEVDISKYGADRPFINQSEINAIVASMRSAIKNESSPTNDRTSP